MMPGRDGLQKPLLDGSLNQRKIKNAPSKQRKKATAETGTDTQFLIKSQQCIIKKCFMLSCVSLPVFLPVYRG